MISYDVVIVKAMAHNCSKTHARGFEQLLSACQRNPRESHIFSQRRREKSTWFSKWRNKKTWMWVVYVGMVAMAVGTMFPVAVLCREFPTGCNDEQEDFLDADELWDNAFNYGQVGSFDEARICFEVYVGMKPASDKGWQLLSEVHTRLGNPKGGLRHASVAARIGGERAEAAEAHFLLANAYLQVFEYGLARQHYYRAIRVDPQHVNSMVNLGVVLGNNNNYAEAIPIYRRALQFKPDIMAARHNLGSALHTTKVFIEALAVLEALVVDEPACFECWLSLGHTLSEVKQLSRAISCYKKVIKKCYTYIHTHIHTYMHTCIHACIHTCIHAYIHTYIHTCIHTYVYTDIHTYTYIQGMDIYMYTHTHTHTHTHTGDGYQTDGSRCGSQLLPH